MDSVKALASLLKKDPVFENYEIIVAAGDGMSFEEEQDDFRNNVQKQNLIKQAILNIVADEEKTLKIYSIIENNKEDY